MDDKNVDKNTAELCDEQSGEAVADERSDGGATIAMGIRGRLFLALGVLSLTTLAAIGVSWVALSSVNNTLGTIINERTPAVVDTLRLAEAVAQVSATAPVLASATNAQEQAEIARRLETARNQVDAVLKNGTVTLEGVGKTEAALNENLNRLKELVKERNALRQALAAKAQVMKKSHQALLAALAPIADNADFDLIMGADSIDPTQPDAVSNFIESGVGPLTAAIEAKAATNDIVGLLSTAANERAAENIQPLRERFNAADAALAKALEELKDQEGIKAVISHAKTLRALGADGDNIFDIRFKELKIQDEIAALLSATRALASDVSAKVAQAADRAKAQMVDETSRARDAEQRNKILLLAITGVSVTIALLISIFYVGRNLVRRLVDLSHAMVALADGKLDVEVQTGGTDEIAVMAHTVQIFRDNAREVERLRAEREASERRAQEERRREMLGLADSFENTVMGVVEGIDTAVARMRELAQNMAQATDLMTRESGSVAAATEQATTNVQTVATAAEELSTSIGEISRQVSESSNISKRAVDQARRTNDTVQGLASASHKIGEIVDLISDIAEQTNLLALNATIEAARAGEAGKGFAVVAAEVKNLANQTGCATEEIAQQIQEIQAVSEETVRAIREIGETIEQVNEIAATIAAAVEEQSAATGEISRNVQEAASGTQEVSGKIAGVSQASTETGAAAGEVLQATEGLASEAAALREQVDAFLSKVRAA